MDENGNKKKRGQLFPQGKFGPERQGRFHVKHCETERFLSALASFLQAAVLGLTRCSPGGDAPHGVRHPRLSHPRQTTRGAITGEVKKNPNVTFLGK